MTQDYTADETHLQAARRLFKAGHNDSALNQILWHLEAQQAPAETTLDYTVCHRCMHYKHDHTDQGCRICHLCDPTPESTPEPATCQHEELTNSGFTRPKLAGSEFWHVGDFATCTCGQLMRLTWVSQTATTRQEG